MIRTSQFAAGFGALALIAVALAACSPAAAPADTPAADAATEALPAEVVAFMAERSRECTADLGGTMEEPEGFLLRADFNADGRTDYAIDGGKYVCSGAYSMYCGSAGCEANLFVSGADGAYSTTAVHTGDELKVTADPAGDGLDIGIPWVFRNGAWGPAS